MLFTGILLGLLVHAALVVWRCTFRVGEGHRAVLVTFGRAETKADGHTLVMHGPGLHWKKPWQHALDVSMKEQSLDLGDDNGAATAMASDGTILRLEAFVRYVPLEAELGRFLFGMARPVEHITGLFTCLLRNEIANIRPHVGDSAPPSDALATRFDFASQAGAYALVRQERKLLNDRIQSFCDEQIAGRYGVRFNAIDLADILPPDELADALNAVMQSESEADARLHRVEGECRQRIVSAERGVEIARARSRAAEIEIVKLATFLAELEQRGMLAEYVARRRAEVASESRALFVNEVNA